MISLLFLYWLVWSWNEVNGLHEKKQNHYTEDDVYGIAGAISDEELFYEAFK